MKTKNKDIFDEMENNKENKEKVIKKDILKISMIILSSILILLSGYNLYLNISKVDDININYLIINSLIIFIVSIFILLTNLLKNKLHIIFKYITITSLIFYVGFNVLVDNNIVKISKQKLMPNLVGLNYTEVNKWANDNNITLETKYEYSDEYKEYEIISQNIMTDTLLKKVKNLTITISKGPDYNKSVIISNMNGWNIDDAVSVIKSNFLNNVEINYVNNLEYAKDTIIEQNIKGNIKRNDKLILTVSLGEIKDSIEMINSDITLFELRLWLKRNGINYIESFEYSDTIKRNEIISVSKNENEIIDIKNEKISIIISKGRSITVPNIISMNIDELTKWIIDNNLKIDYEDKYDDTIPLGGIISSNYNENDTIEEETTIKVVTSKGPLKMEAFSSLSDFRSWAEKYDIKYTEEYQYNDNISKGKIIKFSINTNDIIKNNQVITVYVSNGKAITIPNFINKSKTEANKLCNNLGLKCSFVYGSYSSSNKDTILNQNKKAGANVVSGTAITLTLSKGPASSCSVYIQSSWLSNSADSTITSLKNKLTNELKSKGCSDITFNFKKKCYNTYPSGLIGPDSPIKGGVSNTYTEGNTYTIYITDTNACN